jgi:hypothetical protein
VAFGGLLLVPIGAAWLISNRPYALAKMALVVAAFIAGGAALVNSRRLR